MAGSRTQARGFQPMPSVTEKCYPITLSAALAPEPSLAMPTVSDPSVTKCDTHSLRGLFRWTPALSTIPARGGSFSLGTNTAAKLTECASESVAEEVAQ
jgi:hypothetical protein